MNDTEHEPQWPPPGVDFSKPSMARAYDALLGGKDNVAIDRELADRAATQIPGLREAALEQRRVLVRGVRFLARDAGIAQFLDLGSGLPAAQNTHQVAQEYNPRARVAYVDNDPVVLAHGRALLADSGNTTVSTADVRDARQVLRQPAVRGLLDFGQPTALMLVGMMHYLSPEVVDDVMSTLRDALAPGSYLFFTSMVDTGIPEQLELARVNRENMGVGWARTPEELTRLMGDFVLVEPGMVPPVLWRPDTPVDAETLPTDKLLTVAAVARKPRSSPTRSTARTQLAGKDGIQDGREPRSGRTPIIRRARRVRCVGRLCRRGGRERQSARW
ncbi:SAM-dependent methyltransferase [Spiractinospora alimapuensis]|uniref:SAM-dependent methyltransferase n=1 Tax=Spiractinospora alimapuensis TaxID=2820884 RepID=UPI001F330317|nr:SAM-dependent methyltransferase [Spiractinospora alimapuensis]QVQ53962.1 SAM-dependent methyltransferase [Spiractinospora alimapuensis]